MQRPRSSITGHATRIWTVSAGCGCKLAFPEPNRSSAAIQIEHDSPEPSVAPEPHTNNDLPLTNTDMP